MAVFRRTGILCMALILLLFTLPAVSADSSDEPIPPAWPVPSYVTRLLEIASGEVGYTEEEHGRTKYGEWAGDPYCQWCAEFLCWCVDQVDRFDGTSLLNTVFPRYSGSNTGRNWFITAGRYVVRKGQVEGWGYEWLRGRREYIRSGDYVPQPGDWVFFTWTGDENTDHVALVEYCTRNSDTGNISVHVIEGNKPSSVARETYDLNYSRILGYGTVHDVADITMQFGNRGEKVRSLQEKLAYLGYLDPDLVNGSFGDATAEAVRYFQTLGGLRTNGIANQSTQLLLNQVYEDYWSRDPEIWKVSEDDE